MIVQCVVRKIWLCSPFYVLLGCCLYSPISTEDFI